MPNDSNVYRNLANARGLSTDEYSMFLFGLPFCAANVSVTDDRNLYWIKDIPQERFVYVKTPAGVNAEMTLSGHSIGTEGQNAFALGNAVYGFYIFFDKNQFVQGREFPNWLKNSECRLVLNINCRNTFSIADTSGKPIGVEPKVKNKGVKGDMPKFYICDDKAAGLKKLSVLIDQYRNNGYAYNQICILTVKTETTSFLQGVEKIGNHSIKTTRGNSNVLFTTARKFKGLEADAIIIIDADTETFADEEGKRLFYVGASRAKHYLDIVFVGGKAELEDIVSKIGDKKYPTPFIGIARSLNVKPMSE